MLSEFAANRLGLCGVALGQGARMAPVQTMVGASPFFIMSADSDDPTANELLALEAFVASYISTRHAATEIRERFWGVGVEPIQLRKVLRFWFHRPKRGADAPIWMPKGGLALEDLLETI